MKHIKRMEGNHEIPMAEKIVYRSGRMYNQTKMLRVRTQYFTLGELGPIGFVY